ncbi:MAG: tail fiber protein [Phycisphaerales bacterium]|nr:tail fiber protein [Phycisphaerales bacterium]
MIKINRICAVALLGFACSSGSCQDSNLGVPLANTVESTIVKLEGGFYGFRGVVVYSSGSDSGQRVFFPTMGLGGVYIEDSNGEYIDVEVNDSRIEWPAKDLSSPLVVNVMDFAQGDSYRKSLKSPLENRGILQGADEFQTAKLTDSYRFDAELWANGNVVSETQLLRGDGAYQNTIHFSLSDRAWEQLRKVRAASSIQVVLKQTFPAQFVERQFSASTSFVERADSTMYESLVSAPDGEKPSAVIPVGGSGSKSRVLRDWTSSQFAAGVMVREGADADLVSKLLDRVLASTMTSLNASKLKEENSNIAFLTEDGLQISLAINNIDSILDALKTDNEDEFKRRIRESEERDQSGKIKGKYAAVEGEAEFAYKKRTDKELDLETMKRVFRDMKRQVDGDLTTVQAIEFDSIGQVEAWHNIVSSFAYDEFKLGQSTLEYRLALSLLKDQGRFETEVGMVTAFAGEDIPDGWVICDGSPLPIEEHEDLHQVIGQTYLQDGKHDGTQVNTGTHFRVPDLRGMFIRGFDGSGRVDKEVMREFGTSQDWTTGMPENKFATKSSGKHSHKFGGTNGNGHGSAAFPGAGDDGAGGWDDNRGETRSNGTHSHEVTGGDKETRPVNVTMYYIIKVR